MNTTQLKQELQNIDIYLLDQILKERYLPEHKILDAGCGGGRNIFWLLKNGFDVYATDAKKSAVEALIKRAESLNLVLSPDKIQIGDLETLQYDSATFDHIICSAVLHFAKSHNHFKKMFSELVRVLKTGGMLFIRMTSDIGIKNLVDEIDRGVYDIPDGSIRYLLTKEMLAEIMDLHQLTFIEPLKTVNVNDVRCMSTLVLRKNW